MDTAAKLAIIVPAGFATALLAIRYVEDHAPIPPPSSLSHAPSNQMSRFEGQAVIVDGDTIKINGNRIRFFGMDAPEHNQTCEADGQSYACGQQATDALGNLIGNNAVRCDQLDTDKYGRAVSRCWVGTVDLGGAMVSEGWAIAYRNYSLDYVGIESQAKAARRGIWAGTFMDPADFRHGHIGNSNG